jgi:hypothetical protein
MVSAADIFNTSGSAASFALGNNAASRPAFELQFSQLQNTVINRINQEIEKVNKDNSGSNVDAFLVLEKTRLGRMSDALSSAQMMVGRAFNGAKENYNDLSELDGLVDTAASDPTAFNTLLAKINQTTSLIQAVDGTAVDVLVPDGVPEMKRDGALRVTRNGESVKVTSFADFADASEAHAAITQGLSRMASVVNVLNIKADVVASRKMETDKSLSSVSLQIEAIKTEASAERATKIKELQDKYSQMLNALSVMFEGQQAINDGMSKNLFSGPDVQKGSVMNMFT